MVSGGYISGVNGGPSLQQCFSQIGASDVALSSGANSAGAGFVFGTEGSSALANFRSGPAANLGRMFGNVGNFVGGMGMGMAPQAPMIGAGVAIGFACGGVNPPPPPSFGPNVFANQGANAAAPAGGGMSVDASDKGDKAEEKNQITPEVREAARKQIQGKGGGYSDEDITAILKRAEEASGNDRRKFEEIIRALPPRPAKFEDQKQGDKVVVSADQQRQKWVREFGDWQARYLEKIDPNDNKSAARDNVVSEFAAEGAPSYTLRRKHDAASKGVGYEVTSAQGKTEVNAGARVYFNPQNKHWYKDAAMTQELSLPGTADATTKPDSISVGGGGSYMSVKPDGSVADTKPRSGTDSSHMILDRYVVEGEPVGAAASGDFAKIPTVDGKRYVYFNREKNVWVYRNDKGEPIPLAQPPTYRNGRLYYGSSDAVNPEKANNVVSFMDGMHRVAGEYDKRSKEVKPLEENQKGARAEQVWKEFKATVGDNQFEGISYEYKDGVFTINCPQNQADRFARVMDPDKKSTRGDAVLRDLPEGTRIRVNTRESFPASAGCYKQLSEEVKRAGEVPGPADANAAMKELDEKAAAVETAARAYKQTNPTADTANPQSAALNKAMEEYKAAIDRMQQYQTTHSNDQLKAKLAEHRDYYNAIMKARHPADSNAAPMSGELPKRPAPAAPASAPAAQPNTPAPGATPAPAAPRTPAPGNKPAPANPQPAATPRSKPAGSGDAVVSS